MGYKTNEDPERLHAQRGFWIECRDGDDDLEVFIAPLKRIVKTPSNLPPRQ
jgi:hypothetical protein